MPARFRDRLLLLMVGLVFATGVIMVAAVVTASRQQSVADATARVATGARVLERLLETRAEMLASAVTGLTGDFGFRRAVGTRERDTIASMLANHGNRIGADLEAVVTLDGETLGATIDTALPQTLLDGVLPAAGNGTPVTFVAALGDAAYQVVAAPVYLPEQIGWALIGFRIDNALAAALSDLTGTEIAFVGGGGSAQTISVFAATTPGAAMAWLTGPQRDDARWLSRAIEPRSRGSVPVRALVQVSLDDALASYRRLRNRLLVVLALALALSVALAMTLARRVTQPVTRLVATAKRIREGDYATPVELAGADEFQELAVTLDTMREGIAQREARIVYAAEHDALTGLGNRNALSRRLDARVAAARPFALIALRLDRFRQINEALGAQLGDDILRRVAARLGDVVDTGNAARIGNRTFALVCDAAALAEASTLAASLADAVAEPVELQGIRAELVAGIGVALFPQHADGVDDLMRRAEIALAGARGGHVAFYEPGEDENRRRRLSIVNDLKGAIDAGQLHLCYQPKVALANGRCRSVEALVRWQHPNYGFMPPDEFIGVAERAGIIGHLTRWVVETAAAQVARWQAAGFGIGVAINLSALDLEDETLPAWLDAALQRHGLAPDRFTLEITESAVISDIGAASALLATLATRGYRIAIDDFGTGQSSLAQLGSLPARELKIDRSFVMAMDDDDKAQNIVRSMIGLARSMGLGVVAEGIETPSMWAALRELGCDEAQGYLINRPLTADAMDQWLHSTGGRFATTIDTEGDSDDARAAG